MPWDPNQYHRFRAERSAPFHDLLQLLQTKPHLQVIDLGCGTGELTAQLAKHLPASNVTGIDNSPQMLAHAQTIEHDRLHFQLGRIEDMTGTYDVIFSNAALQWLPNHHSLIPRLWKHLNPGGQLAVQVPSNFDHPSHRLLAETATEERFASALDGWTREATAPVGHQSPVLNLTAYAELLFELGGQDITAFEKIYPVVLESADGILEWVSGTALVPYLERLPEELRSDFREAYRARLWTQWPHGPAFYAFKRTLFSATRGSS